MKPIVKYDEKGFTFLELGTRAYVFAHGHPHLGTQRVHTSTVIAINSDGSFETLNTIYQPIGEQNAN